MQRSLITHADVDPNDIKKLVDAKMDAVILTPEQAQAMSAVMQPAVRDVFLKSTGSEGQKLIDLIDAL